MSRSRRVSVDGNGSNPGSNWQLPVYLDLELGNAAKDYRVVQLDGYGIDIGAPDRVTSVTIWADGLVSFGAPTAAQISFMRNDYPNGADVFGFPGDFISTGHVGPDLPAAFTQDSSYGLFIDFGTLEDQSTGAARDIRGELLVTRDGRVALDGGEDAFSSRIAFRVNGLTWDPTVAPAPDQPDITLAYQLVGDDARQTIVGTASSETIIGKGGGDRLTGGGGVDSFKYLAASDSPVGNADRIFDFQSGIDRIDATGLGVTGYRIARPGALYLIELYSANGTLQITSDNLVGAGDIRIGGGITLAGTAGADAIAGLDGDDIVTGGGGADLLTGNAGRDTFRFAAFTDSTENRRDVITDFVSGADRFDFGALAISSYSIVADGGASIVTLQNGNQRLSVRVEGTIARSDLVTSITQTLIGTAGADTLQALDNGSILQGLDGNDRLTGFVGKDQLIGGTGRDTIDGGDGDDVIVGGADADILTGGYGADIFRYTRASDSIVTITNPGAGDPAYDLSQVDRLTDLSPGDTIDVIALRVTAVHANLADPDNFLLRFDTPGGILGLLVPTFYINEIIDAISYGKPIVATGDNLEGLDGNDRLTGTNLSGHRGDDVLTGGATDDRLDGGAGNDLLAGGAGRDLLIGGGGIDVIRGNAGDDTLATGASGTFYGGDGNDSVDESFLATNLFSAFGGAGNDTLNGTLARTILSGGSGDDHLAAAHGLQAVIDFDGNFQPFVVYDPTFGAGNEMRGGDGNDTIIGAEGDDVAYGGAGDDYISGGEGFDAVTGFGSPFDFPAKDGGADQLFGGAGDDSIDAGSGADLVDGGDGNDTIGGGSSAALNYLHDGAVDILRGGDGDDYFYAVGEGDVVDGGAGFDSIGLDFSDLAGTITYALADGPVTTRSGTFTLKNIEGAYFTGGSEDDIITGGAGTDQFATGGYNGYGGADMLSGAGGDDVFYQYGVDGAVRSIDGGDGNDLLSLSFDSNTAAVNFSLLAGSSITFQSGGRLNYTNVDRLQASGTNNGDTFTGGNYDDLLSGYDGNDTLNGGAGNDFLDGGRGINNLNGGDGLDTASLDFYTRAAVVFTLSSNITVTDYYGTQTLNSIEALFAYGSANNDQIAGGDGANSIYGREGDDTLTGGAAADRLGGQAGRDTLNGLGGDDNLAGDDGDDRLNGGDGRDQIDGGAGDDTIDGGAGSDVITGGAGADNISGGAGDDVIDGGDGEDVIDGGAGVDRVTLDFTGMDAVNFALTANVSVTTARGGKTLLGIEGVTAFGTAFADSFVGGAGSDDIAGSDGADSLAGSGGNDVLIGGEGNDLLAGGDGFDTADWSDDVDGITVDLATGRAVSTSQTDTLTSIEHARGTESNDVISAGTRLRDGSDIVRAGTADPIRLDGGFTLRADTEIDQSTLVPHATVVATASGGEESYLFSVADAGSRLTIDVDHASIDLVVELYDEAGALIASNDDGYVLDPGSDSGVDSLLAYTFDRAGDYRISVRAYVGGPPVAGTSYTLNVSLDHALDFWIAGDGGDDVLVGRQGNDRIDGGDGRDTAVFGDAAAVIADLALGTASGQGVDTLTGIENLTGSGADDSLFGDSGANVLNGRAGADTLVGRAGDDVYRVDNLRDLVIEVTGEGQDLVLASRSYALATGQEIERLETDDAAGTAAIALTGNDFDNVITGNAGANRLNGRRGDDTMIGGAGNDRYTIDSANDRVVEFGNQGDDIVYAGRSYTLEAFQSIERLYALDPAAKSALVLTGNEQANILQGNAGANTLDGGAGDDRLFGGAGDDLYLVDSANDRVFEDVGGGTDDRVLTRVDYSLTRGQEIERLQAFDETGTAPLALTGNEFANILRGNAGANRLDGGAGADRLYGGKGDDAYFVDSTADRVFEDAGGGTDRVTTTATFTLTAGQEIEVLTASGTGAINLTGNELSNIIQGNAAANKIDGGRGADRLIGGGGADTFVFDTALGSGNIDRIDDFAIAAQPVHDVIQLDDAIFTALAAGPLAAGAFKVLGSGAIDGDDRILYNAVTGALLYDADGDGAGAAIQFAVLTGAPALSAADIVVI